MTNTTQRPPAGSAGSHPGSTLLPERQPRFGDAWWNLSFGGILAVALIAFLMWSNGYVGAGQGGLVLAVSVVFAMFMAFTIGGNDVANSFGTSVGAGTLTMRQALLVAAVFEVGGAVLAGGQVTKTVRSGIVDLGGIPIEPGDFAAIMLSALLGAAIWLLVATRFGLPVSTTHSIIGGIVGSALMIGFITGLGSWGMVQWDGIGKIAASWVLSPLLGGTFAWIIFGALKRVVLQPAADIATRNGAGDGEDESSLDPEDVLEAHRIMERRVPVFAAVGAIIIVGMLLVKGLKNLDVHLGNELTALTLLMAGITVWLAVYALAVNLRRVNLARSTFILFSWMQLFTACAFAFSHGSNDIANAIGPFAAVLDVLRTGEISDKAPVPAAALLAMGLALVCGLWFIGRHVIATVGTNITKMHPASGFSAELAAAGVVMSASMLGLPVSSTHILIGAVLGVGVVNGAANWRLMKPIGLAWVVTLPAAAAIAAVSVLGLRFLF